MPNAWLANVQLHHQRPEDAIDYVPPLVSSFRVARTEAAPAGELAQHRWKGLRQLHHNVLHVQGYLFAFSLQRLGQEARCF